MLGLSPLGRGDVITATAADDVTRRRFPLRYPGTYSDDERRNTAMRREACPRSCSTLLSATVSATLSRMYVWHGTAMWARIQTGGSDRLVPPRLRRAAHLLTEYHRDSYIATIMVHTPATRNDGSVASRWILRFALALLPPRRAADSTGGQLIAVAVRDRQIPSCRPVSHVDHLLPSDSAVPCRK